MFKTLKKLPGISIERLSDSKSVALSFNGRLKYEIYPDGRIYFYRYGHNYTYPSRGLAKGKVAKNGYRMVAIQGCHWYEHRIVAELFLDGDIENLCINHKDGNKINNAASNLELVTYSDNIKHAYVKLLRHRPNGRYLGGGVAFDKQRQMWMAYTDYYGRRKFLGRFLTREQATLIRDEEVAKRAS